MRWLTCEAPGVNIRVLPLTSRDPRVALQSGAAELAVGHFPGVMANDLWLRAAVAQAGVHNVGGG